jgi:2-oxoglutarate dehydrogenase E2 component (dihydrolipoamide succinyltransferase)
MPKLGESITEATILKWHKNPGDQVKMDETVLDIATDKVDSEVPSTADGVVESILFKINDVVPVGSVIARIKTNAEEPVLHEAPKAQPVLRNIANQHTQEAVVVETTSSPPSKNQSSNGLSNRFYSPLVLNIAANEGVSMTELEAIPGTGNEGRVTKKDILQYVSDRKSGMRGQKPEQRREEQRKLYTT